MRFLAMEYITVQNYSGFNQIAICPGVWVPPGLLQISSRSLLSESMSNSFVGNFYIVDKTENACLTVNGEGSFSLVPYFPGHFYYLYRGKDDQGKEFKYYDSSEEIRKFLLNHFHTPLVSFNMLNVSTTREFVPHLTFSNSELSFEYDHSEDQEDADSRDFTSKEVSNELSHELLNNFLAFEEKENVPNFCISLLEELMMDVVSRGERCHLCFVTHFPWLKVCRKNNKVTGKSLNMMNEFKTNFNPKLRG